MQTQESIEKALRDGGIKPSAQRMAVASYVLSTEDHPSADEVCRRVRAEFPQISRATVYNTLNLLVEKGLLRSLAITQGRVVFDPNMSRHHHLIDEESGEICDIPWDDLRVSEIANLEGFEVTDYQVVLRGRRR